MRPIEGTAILTAAAMRAAEAASGASPAELMDRAGQGVAAAVRRLSVGAEVLMLVGPGNNGGDGWVAAATLAAAGHPVRVAQLADAATDIARAARARWSKPVATLAAAEPAPILVDALFGTGLSRPLDRAVTEALDGLVQAAQLSIAVDLPSGLDSDTGAGHPDRIAFDITLALGALKPAHVLYPAADACGAVRLIDIGLGLDDISAPEVSRDRVMQPSFVAPPGSSSHKYSRGLVLVIGGDMPGAAMLAATAAMHAGAGYVTLFADQGAGDPPHALVRRAWSPDALDATLHGKNPSHTAIVIGPGLGKDDAAREKLAAAIAADCPLVIDGDALHLLDDAAFARFRARPAHHPIVLTPHAGEFAALFGDPPGNKIDAARDAAIRSGAIVVFKGPDTVVAYPDGRTRIAPRSSFWLSTAGTGDVLAGTIATLLCASAIAPVEAAVQMHADAARRLGPAFIADELACELATARASP